MKMIALIKFSIEDSDKDPINKETDLVKEYDEVEEDVEPNKDENDSDDCVNHKFSIEDNDEDLINKETVKASSQESHLWNS